MTASATLLVVTGRWSVAAWRSPVGQRRTKAEDAKLVAVRRAVVNEPQRYMLLEVL